MRKFILLILCIIGLMYISFIMGIATAFMYPQECYDIFIDKEYPCKITN